MATVTITVTDDEEQGRVTVSIDAGTERVSVKNPEQNTDAQNLALEILFFVGNAADKLHRIQVDGKDVPIVNANQN